MRLHVEAWKDAPMDILLTGAAGLIGGEVARRLVARGHRVTAGVHRNRTILGNDGSEVAVAGLLTIDLATPGLGLDDETRIAVADAHDLIIHCAATVRFDLAEAEYRAVNVDGTAAVVELAQARAIPLIHVSTAYVCGNRDGAIGEDDPLPDAGFANGYEASKAAAEAVVAASGLPYAIVRPSIVVGDYDSGAIRHFDTIYAAFKLIAEARVTRLPARAEATLDFVPIDHVAGGIVAIAEDMTRAAGGRYHLVSGRPIGVADWAAVIGSYPQFAAPTYVDPAAFDPATLPPLERRLYTRVAGLYSSYFQRNPRFDDTRFRALTGVAAPPANPAFVARLIDHCIAAGFLSAT